MNSNRLFSFVCFCIIAVAVVAGGYWFWQYWELSNEFDKQQKREAVLRMQLAEQTELLRENQRILERLRTDPSYVEMVIRRRLGYVKPGELIFHFEHSNDVFGPLRGSLEDAAPRR